MNSPDTPTPPDYRAAAKEQAEYNQQAMLQQTISNRPNQENPLGTLEWTIDPDTGQWTQTERYDPRIQGMLDTSLAHQGQLQGQMGDLMNRPSWQTQPGAELYEASPLGIGGYNQQGLGVGTYDQASGDAFAKKYAEAQLARIRPEQQEAQRQTEVRLRLQGLQPGTEAYDRAYKNLLTSQGDVNAQAYLEAELAGGQEGRDIYNTQLQAALQKGEHGRSDYRTAFEAQQRMQDVNRQNYATRMMGQQQMNEQSLQEYLQPQNDLANWQSMAQGYMGIRPGYQSFVSAGGAAGPDMMGATQQQYAQQVQRANDEFAQRAQTGSMWGSVIGGVAGSFIPGVGTAAGAAAGGAIGSYGYSDEALKEDILVVSDESAYNAMLRVHPHSFVWPNGKVGTGLIAQEVQAHFPQLVEEGEQGYLKVDYESFVGLLLGAFRHLAKQQMAPPDYPRGRL